MERLFSERLTHRLYKKIAGFGHSSEKYYGFRISKRSEFRGCLSKTFTGEFKHVFCKGIACFSRFGYGL